MRGVVTRRIGTGLGLASVWASARDAGVAPSLAVFTGRDGNGGRPYHLDLASLPVSGLARSSSTEMETAVPPDGSRQAGCVLVQETCERRRAMRHRWKLRSAGCIMFLAILQATAVQARQNTPNSAYARCEQGPCTTGELACFKARCSPITFGCRIPCGDIYSGACLSMCRAIGDDSGTCAAQFAAQATACFRTCWNSDKPGACGDACKAAAATAYNQCKSGGSTRPTQEAQPAKNVQIVGRIATITSVKGSPSVTRRGVKITVGQGDSINAGDTISTGPDEKITFESGGDSRTITQQTTLTIERRSGKDGNPEVVEKLWGTLETVLSPYSAQTPVESQVVTGGRLNMNGAEYRQFSHVRYQFDDVEDRVTVFEGRVEATDPRTGERRTITQGQAFALKVGRPLGEARITSGNQPSLPPPDLSPVDTRPATGSSPSLPGSAIRSSFASDAEGWTGGSFPDNGPYDSVIARAPVRWNQGAGRAGGAISMTDPGLGNFFFEAPGAFLGNKQASYGGELRYDVRSEGGEQFDEADVILISQGFVLVYRAPNRPTSAWATVSVPLIEPAWKVDRPAGRAPTRAEFERALASISALRIRGEYRNGPETGWLGNVSLVAPSGGVSTEPGPVRDPQVTRQRAPAIARILTSDAVNDDGRVVLLEKPWLDRTAPKIYVTVQVADARKGIVVSVSVTYLGNNASLGPLHNEITADGDVMKAFSFTNAAKEWPVGDFRVTVGLSDGTRQTRDFKIK